MPRTVTKAAKRRPWETRAPHFRLSATTNCHGANQIIALVCPPLHLIQEAGYALERGVQLGGPTSPCSIGVRSSPLCVYWASL
jgi:hypothetical protein